MTDTCSKDKKRRRAEGEHPLTDTRPEVLVCVYRGSSSPREFQLVSGWVFQQINNQLGSHCESSASPPPMEGPPIDSSLCVVSGGIQIPSGGVTEIDPYLHWEIRFPLKILLMILGDKSFPFRMVTGSLFQLKSLLRGRERKTKLFPVPIKATFSSSPPDLPWVASRSAAISHHLITSCTPVEFIRRPVEWFAWDEEGNERQYFDNQ